MFHKYTIESGLIPELFNESTISSPNLVKDSEVIRSLNVFEILSYLAVTRQFCSLKKLSFRSNFRLIHQRSFDHEGIPRLVMVGRSSLNEKKNQFQNSGNRRGGRKGQNLKRQKLCGREKGSNCSVF
jgi:hypothetical protein